MRTATVEGTKVQFYTIRKHMVFGKERLKLIPGWWAVFNTRRQATDAARAWRVGIRIRSGK